MRLGDEPEVEGGDETLRGRANAAAQRQGVVVEVLGSFRAQALDHHHQRPQAQLQRQFLASQLGWIGGLRRQRARQLDGLVEVQNGLDLGRPRKRLRGRAFPLTDGFVEAIALGEVPRQHLRLGLGPCGKVLTQHACCAFVQGATLTGFVELAHGVLARTLQQAVAAVGLCVQHHKRSINQAAQGLDDGPLILSVVAGGLGRLIECKARREDPEAPEHRLFIGRQQPVAPIERCAQRALPRRRAARALAQQLKALRQPGLQALQAEQRHSRSSHLDGQRHTIEMHAQIHHGWQVV